MKMELLLGAEENVKTLVCARGQWLARTANPNERSAMQERPWCAVTVGAARYYFRRDLAYILMCCRSRDALHVIPFTGGDDFGESRGLSVVNGDEDFELSDHLDSAGVDYRVVEPESMIVVTSEGTRKWRIRTR